MRPTNWNNKLALITGASSGIGAAVGRLLAGKGLHVVLTARRTAALEALAEEIGRTGGMVSIVTADLAEPDAREVLMEEVRAKFGVPDVLVNNAGFAFYGFHHQLEQETAMKMVAVNLEAALHLTLGFLPEMVARGSGSIAQIGSMSGDIPSQGTALYSATKAFVGVFTTGLYRELRGSGVNVGVVKPGPVKTELFDVSETLKNGGRVPAEKAGVPPERVARAVWSLLNRPRRVVYVPGWLALTPWVELAFGWAMDLVGPVLLKRDRL